jgi:hypothetical protein
MRRGENLEERDRVRCPLERLPFVQTVDEQHKVAFLLCHRDERDQVLLAV